VQLSVRSFYYSVQSSPRSLEALKFWKKFAADFHLVVGVIVTCGKLRCYLPVGEANAFDRNNGSRKLE